MITKLGHKYKLAQGWLGNKVRDIRIQGSKILNSPVVKVGLAVGAGALAVNSAINQGAKNERSETTRRLDASGRQNVDEVSFNKTAPSTADFFSNPSKMHPADRMALGYTSDFGDPFSSKF